MVVIKGEWRSSLVVCLYIVVLVYIYTRGRSKFFLHLYSEVGHLGLILGRGWIGWLYVYLRRYLKEQNVIRDTEVYISIQTNFVLEPFFPRLWVILKLFCFCFFIKLPRGLVVGGSGKVLEIWQILSWGLNCIIWGLSN